MANEKIEVGYKPLSGVYFHKYIVYTDTNGNQHIAHGGPTWPIWGDIETDHGRAGSSEELYAGEWDERLSDHRETIIEQEDLSAEWAKIKDLTDEIEGERHDYRVWRQNSNSLVDTVLSRVGLPLPQDNYEEDDEFEGGLNAPGSNNILPDLPPASDIILDPADYNPILPNPLLIPDLPFLSDLLNPPISPLVLDMDGDGIELVALSDSQAMFDLDNDNFAQHMGWVAADDALLAIDRNGNGRIDDINEVFGNGTVDGFTELAALDSNGDGTIDASDARFGDLRLWRDQNGNGRSEADELQGLADGGVRSIALNATARTRRSRVTGSAIRVRSRARTERPQRSWTPGSRTTDIFRLTCRTTHSACTRTWRRCRN